MMDDILRENSENIPEEILASLEAFVKRQDELKAKRAKITPELDHEFFAMIQEALNRDLESNQALFSMSIHNHTRMLEEMLEMRKQLQGLRNRLSLLEG